MEKSDGRVLAVGRRSACGKKAAGRNRRFSESFLFTLGLVFVIVYFAGLLWSSGIKETSDREAVAVFAQSGGSPEKTDGIWDKLENCFEHVFVKGDGEAK